jgi:hypothetical protein
VSGGGRLALDIVDNAEKGVVLVKDESGIKLTGESGEEDGEGSEREAESVVDMVVVGDESADSVFWVEVLSL